MVPQGSMPLLSVCLLLLSAWVFVLMFAKWLLCLRMSFPRSQQEESGRTKGESYCQCTMTFHYKENSGSSRLLLTS